MSLLIQKLRLQRGWSQQQLADLSGLSVRTVQRIESGQKATAESLKSLAAVFEVEFQALRAAVEGEDEPSPGLAPTPPVSSPSTHDPEPAAMTPITDPAATYASPHPHPHPHREARLDLSDDEVRAFRHVRKLRGFYIHLMIYVAVITGLVILNLWRTPDRLWVLGPMFGWGIGITAHALSVFGGGRLFGPQWERRQVEKQLGRKLVLALAAGVAFGAHAPDAMAANAVTLATPVTAPGLADILVRVPVWVWVWIVLGVLAVAGAIFRRGTTSRPAVTLLVSLGFVAWSLAGVVDAFGGGALPLAYWAIGAVCGVALGSSLLAPRGLRLVGVGRVQVPGSWTPLVVMMGIFGLKFVHGVVTGAHLPLAAHGAYLPVMAALLGALSGVFLARALAIVRFVRAQRGVSSSRVATMVPAAGGVALAALVTVSALGSAADAHAAGFQRVELADAQGTIEVAIWYPSDAAPQNVAMGPIEQRVAVGAPVRGERLPLVVFSHGTGGSSLSHIDTGIALADAGFVAVGLAHPGDNFRDTSRARQIDGRMRHVSLVLDHMTKTSPLAAAIDASRIGVLGMSAGGYTALRLIGGESDLAKVVPYCRDYPTHYVCGVVNSGANADAPSPAAVGSPRDARIRAAVVAAPALGFTFDARSLESITMPVQLWRAENDTVLPEPHYVEAVRRSMPKADYRIVKGAGHYDFLAPCSAALAAVAKVVCEPTPGFDRTAFKGEFNREVVAFFRRTLGGAVLAR